ncbi:septum formation protein Maf [Clostridium tepidiprofundi DSM 19306]|uniref:dTTP/UTP pyrophosphatase n=1 Tax=Clostridium tepidiprofundi DSM 19306 TaxID=1121338 RepID=A0A151B3K5_9CLOT|nr:Maf family protein [Clostridium tepidiprofundi]KYH34476.1 septum formation protein Maf [Clostridium tepidiprofundi DSM 19306]
MDIILASASPRRKELLDQIGVSFKVIPSKVDENFDMLKGTIESKVEELAYIKAKEVAQKVNKGLILGADTIVVIDEEILGKPLNDEDAFNMLSRLSGREHKVITGIALIDVDNNRHRVTHESTKVIFDTLTKERIIEYIKTGEPNGKAGAYAIQGRAAVFVKKIEGCYFNVVGLPISKVNSILKEFGIDVL